MTVMDDWSAGTGLDTDMEGDPIPGSAKGMRFWMKKGTTRDLIFLTEGNAAKVIWEHQVQLGGTWTNWFSCLQALKIPCPLCAWADQNKGKFGRYKGMFFTVIDTSEYTNKKGELVKNQRRLVVAKFKLPEIIKLRYQARIEEGEGLRGAMFTVYRTNNDNSYSVGDDWTFKKMIDLMSLPETEEIDVLDRFRPNLEVVQSVVDRLVREKGATGDQPAKEEGTNAAVNYGGGEVPF